MAALPDRVLAKFRSISGERLARIEVAWMALIRGEERGQERTLLRDLHTLKGDSQMVGMRDVVALAAKLEDLVALASAHAFRITEDVDILATMAIQFAQLYVRTRQPGQTGSSDLLGFFGQVDMAIADLQNRGRPVTNPPTQGLKVAARERAVQGVDAAALGSVATMLYFELLRAEGVGKERLRRAFDVLIGEIAELEASPLHPMLVRAGASTSELARTLGKELTVHVDGGEVRAAMAVIEALQVATMHALRNAVDHAIESPTERVAAGKARAGEIHLTASGTEDWITVEIRDDGRGVDLERVRAIAETQGLLAPDAAKQATKEQLLELLFHPGFTTRGAVTDTSGRGIGMDAARAELSHFGGSVDVATEAGRGSSVRFRIPPARSAVEVVSFVSDRGGVEFALPAAWEVIEQPVPVGLFDPFAALDLPAPAPHGSPASRSVFSVRNGPREYAFGALGPPKRTRAARRWPTPDTEPAEVVQIAGREVVLLRI
jgi:two-component system chemotaxis sensor kinase CheA